MLWASRREWFPVFRTTARDEIIRRLAKGETLPEATVRATLFLQT